MLSLSISSGYVAKYGIFLIPLLNEPKKTYLHSIPDTDRVNIISQIAVTALPNAAHS